MQQLTLMLRDELVAFIRQAADREARSISNQPRFWVMEKARIDGLRPAEPMGRPAPTVAHTWEAINEARGKLAELQGECDRLVALQK